MTDIGPARRLGAGRGFFLSLGRRCLPRQRRGPIRPAGQLGVPPPSDTWTVRAVLLMALVVVGCSDGVAGPEIPPDAAEYAPPPQYEFWWRRLFREMDIEPRDVSHVRWFRVTSGPWHSSRYRTEIEGSWIPDGRIYIAAGYVRCENLVKHEMAHEILQGDREHEHPIFAAYPLGVGACL